MTLFRSFVKAPKTNQLIVYREVIVVCSDIHTEHIITLRGHNIGFLNVKWWYI